MICTYEEYLKQPKAISFEKMQMIHAEMLAEIGADTEALELYDDLIKIATRYATIRANWLLLSREEKNEQDSGRTSCHNSVIIHFNMLARYLKQQGRTALLKRCIRLCLWTQFITRSRKIISISRRLHM